VEDLAEGGRSRAFKEARRALLTLSGFASLAAGIELDAIAAVVIGGTSLSGGRGSVAGTVLGCLIIGVLNNGLTLLDVSPFWQQVVKGLVIIAAVAIDRSGARTLQNEK
jgi:ribose/xylose/arabinose/galactoside ABC-type transport system permease subunit